MTELLMVESALLTEERCSELAQLKKQTEWNEQALNEQKGLIRESEKEHIKLSE
jgi:hypothetical protein